MNTITRYPMFILLPVVLLVSCGLLNSKEKPDPFEPVFKAHINGELINGIGTWSEQFPPEAGIFLHEDDEGNEFLSLTISNKWFYPDIYPHNDNIFFSVNYTEGKSTYPTLQDTIRIHDGLLRFGASYIEIGGDVLITGYESQVDDEGYITVHFDTLDSGEVVTFGTFETRVTTYFGASPSYSPWHGVDTLHITNGEYRVLLRDRRNE